jgi:hypothetical protein
MKEGLKCFLERTTPLGILTRLHRNMQLRKKFRRWQAGGAVLPMPNWGKQAVVIEYIRRFQPGIFIETGTYKGKMVYSVIPYIKEIYSIELDPRHHENAARRFAGYPNIHILPGQSGEVLPGVLAKINQPCLFWLDAHWSGGSTAKTDIETPVMQELECILNHKMASDHVILIDDARCFTGEHDYPTLPALRRFVLDLHQDWTCQVKDDIIRIHSNRQRACE